MKKTKTLPADLIVMGTLILVMITGCKKNDDSAEIKDGDGNIYTSITIGTQKWLAQNLKTTKYNDGTDIPLVTDNTEWKNLVSPGYCWYNNDEASNKNVYGAIYNWHAVNTGKLCPKGWHVPSEEEMWVLADLHGGEKSAGGPLKEKGTTHWRSPNTGATDLYGFTALPGGYRNQWIGFQEMYTHCGWWTATKSSSIWDETAYLYIMYYDYPDMAITDVYIQNGYYVRCVKN